MKKQDRAGTPIIGDAREQQGIRDSGLNEQLIIDMLDGVLMKSKMRVGFVILVGEMGQDQKHPEIPPSPSITMMCGKGMDTAALNVGLLHWIMGSTDPGAVVPISLQVPAQAVQSSLLALASSRVRGGIVPWTPFPSDTKEGRS